MSVAKDTTCDTVNDFQSAYAAFKEVENQLNQAFPERKDPIRALMISHLAGEHICLLGAPGTGKTLLTSTFADCVAGGSYFEHLMTKFTVPEEIFGAVSFSSLKKDIFKRNFAGFAPDFKIWFLDEIWKSSSAILNALLKAMNERVIRNGADIVELPLQMVIAASNEYPQDESLQALFDRFTTKFWVEYIADPDNMIRLWSNDGIGKVDAKLSATDTEILRTEMDNIQFTKANIKTLHNIKKAVEKNGHIASDRIWVKCIKMVKAVAVASGRNTIVGSDFLILADMLWKQHEERMNLFTVIGNAADPYGSRSLAIIDGIRKAMTEMPDIQLVKSGAMTRLEFTSQMAKVQDMLGSQNDKIQELAEETKDTEVIQEATSQYDAAIAVTTKLSSEVLGIRTR